jgi:antitoxin StbD
MPQPTKAETCVTISEFKKNPSATVARGDGFPVTVLNRNKPDFYCIPAAAWEKILELIEDVELNVTADARQNQAVIGLALDDL